MYRVSNMRLKRHNFVYRLRHDLIFLSIDAHRRHANFPGIFVDVIDHSRKLSRFKDGTSSMRIGDKYVSDKYIWDVNTYRWVWNVGVAVAAVVADCTIVIIHPRHTRKLSLPWFLLG